MASSSLSPFPPPRPACAQSHVSFRPSSLPFFFPVPPSSSHRSLVLRAAAGSQSGAVESQGGVQDPSVLRRPSVSVDTCSDDNEVDNTPELSRDELDTGDGVPEEGELDERSPRGQRKKRRDTAWVDWEDQILEDTVPLVGFVRMILHSGKYESGDRLSPEHQKTILERLLVHHPQCEKKIGCGIDYITIGYHPDFEGSRCLFIVRKDGELVDFSYWKCIKSLIRKKYPLYADSFILRHFRRRRNPE